MSTTVIVLLILAGIVAAIMLNAQIMLISHQVRNPTKSGLALSSCG